MKAGFEFKPVKHKTDCKRVFANYDLSCARCVELDGGAAPREGWGDRKKKEDAEYRQAIARHFKRDASGTSPHQRDCGPISTCFEW